MDTSATGRFIAELRKQKGYTQKELAERLAVTDKAISRWETGKGLPDTSLLKPLADILGVSVGELLSGKILEEAELKEETDNLLLESFGYFRRMHASTVSVIILILGVALTASPLFTASKSYVWILGIAVLAVAVLMICVRRKGYSMKQANRISFSSAILLQCAALILEILPIGAVMVFATGPTERVTELCSYFSLLPVGYANVTPLLTGILTASVILMGAIALFRFEKAPKLRKAVFICSIVSFLFSLVPLFLFGAVGMTAASYAISAAILMSACLQAVANRKE